MPVIGAADRLGIRKLRITIEDLLIRARKLSTNELKDVFGGCSPLGGPCKTLSDCCTYTDGKMVRCAIFQGSYCFEQ
jgi:hypothetical protein